MSIDPGRTIRHTTVEHAPHAPDLVGREVELAAIDAVCDRTRGGTCRVVLVRGDAGTGKSRLLDELIRRARVGGFDIAVGRAEDHDRGVAFASLRLALRERLTAESSPRLAGAAAELEQLLFAGTSASDRASATSTVLDLTHRIVTEWAERGPFLLAIDDLHRADPETLDVFGFLARHLAGSRVLLAATTRARHLDLSPDAAVIVDRLRAAATTTVLDLDTLGATDLRVLVGSMLAAEPSTHLLDVIDDATRGNPFFTVELVRALRDDDRVVERDGVVELADEQLVVPANAAVAVLHRVFRLGDRALAIARVASSFSVVLIDQLALVSAITGLDEEATEAGFDLLVRAAILEPFEAGFRFTHAIVRSALYDDLGPAERRRIHAQVAESLTSRRARGAPVDEFELAIHVRASAARGDETAAQILLDAGDRLVRWRPVLLSSGTAVASTWSAQTRRRSVRRGSDWREH